MYFCQYCGTLRAHSFAGQTAALAFACREMGFLTNSIIAASISGSLNPMTPFVTRRTRSEDEIGPDFSDGQTGHGCMLDWRKGRIAKPAGGGWRGQLNLFVTALWIPDTVLRWSHSPPKVFARRQGYQFAVADCRCLVPLTPHTLRNCRLTERILAVGRFAAHSIKSSCAGSAFRSFMTQVSAVLPPLPASVASTGIFDGSNRPQRATCP
jgi:hypothetical protein